MEEILLYANSFDKIAKTFNFRLILDIALFLIVTIIIFKFVDACKEKIKIGLKEKNSSMLRFIPTFERLTKGLILFFLVATFLQSHGYSMTSIIAGFGITGLAVGFAAKETISNIFGAIAIFSDKSFKLGDYVIINGVEGTVEDINMRSTKIREVDNSVVILPNSMAANSVIKNISQMKKRRIFETIGVTYDTGGEKLRRAVEIIEEIFTANQDVTKDHYVFAEKFAQSSIDIKFSAYVKTNDFVKFAKIREQILFEILAAYRKEGIELAFPTQTLHVVK
jgi:MscS family membrane protein